MTCLSYRRVWACPQTNTCSTVRLCRWKTVSWFRCDCLDAHLSNKAQRVVPWLQQSSLWSLKYMAGDLLEFLVARGFPKGGSQVCRCDRRGLGVFSWRHDYKYSPLSQSSAWPVFQRWTLSGQPPIGLMHWLWCSPHSFSFRSSEWHRPVLFKLRDVHCSFQLAIFTLL